MAVLDPGSLPSGKLQEPRPELGISFMKADALFVLGLATGALASYLPMLFLCEAIHPRLP